MLWQVGLVGDFSLKRSATGPAYRQVLVDLLTADYPPDHPVIVYRGATLPIEQPSIRHLRLHELPGIELTAEETVILPPAIKLQANTAVRARLHELEAQEAVVSA